MPCHVAIQASKAFLLEAALTFDSLFRIFNPPQSELLSYYYDEELGIEARISSKGEYEEALTRKPLTLLR